MVERFEELRKFPVAGRFYFTEFTFHILTVHWKLRIAVVTRVTSEASRTSGRT